MLRSCCWIAKRFHISLDLLKLLRQRIDLLDLVVDHLDCFRDILEVLNLAERVRNGIQSRPTARAGAAQKNGSAMIKRKSFMSLVALFLNAQSCGARREDDAVLFPLRQRHFEEANVGRIIRLRPDSLPLVERLILLLCSITSSLFIACIVGLPRGSVAPRLERLAKQGTTTRADCREQRIAFSERVSQERPPAAPTVLPMIRVGLTPAQPLNAQATAVV